MSKKKYLLQQKMYQTYLDTMEPGTYVGLPKNAHLCTIARYLNSTYHAEFQVTWEDDTQRQAWYEHMDTMEKHHLPRWAREEASWFDATFPEGGEVTIEMYRKARQNEREGE